jgi:hypothetical protein
MCWQRQRGQGDVKAQPSTASVLQVIVRGVCEQRDTVAHCYLDGACEDFSPCFISAGGSHVAGAAMRVIEGAHLLAA